MNKKLIESIDGTKPFLRWAGGKNWLVKHLHEIKPTFRNYHEAFLGGGSVFFYLNPSKKAFLSDLNKDLIGTYKSLKLNVHEVIEVLKTFENSPDDYYRIRAHSFESEEEKAAKFIFLNQTSYNGIYRVNLRGEYNVPFGYRNKDFLNEKGLLKCHRALQKAELFDGDFAAITENVKKGDLVFLDPPYTVSHNLNGFIKYNEHLFSLEDQHRLSQVIDSIKRKGAFYILTNAAHHKVDEIFEKGDRRLELFRANLIGGANAKRGATSEYMFTNLELNDK